MTKTRRVTNPNTVFQRVGVPGVGSSRFDLSNQVIGTVDMGALYPIYCRAAVPGDRWTLGTRTVIRLNPMLAPLLHEVNLYLYSFFVPYRILDDNWEEFVTGGVDGEQSPSLPRWIPDGSVARGKGSLWDWFGFPVDVKPNPDYAPVGYPVLAYRTIWNEYFRDENLDSEASLDMAGINAQNFSGLRYARWEKDYFASALPWQQRGIAPALPVSGSSSATWDADKFAYGYNNSAILSLGPEGGPVDHLLYGAHDEYDSVRDWFNSNEVSFSNLSTFDISDLRMAAAIQQLLELSARGGIRYTEYLRSGYGVSPRDDRLDRPEYIGKHVSPVLFTDIPQTSAVDDQPTPQGNLAGKGTAIAEGRITSKPYFVEEFGLIMTLAVVRPRAVYTQGFDREWMIQNRYDVYHPLFANLSEQAILRGEIYATGNKAQDMAIWGYQGRYSEYRYSRSRVTGLMHDDFDYWHLARQFANAPALNAAFLDYQGTIRKDFLAVPSEPAMVASFGNAVIADRPMPAVPIPGLGRL